MKLGIAQMDCTVGDVGANCLSIVSMIERAAASSCDVVLLPEMADTGYDMRAILEHASPWDQGPCPLLQETAAKHGITVICGLSEREGKKVYNAVAVIDGAGALVGKYRKAHLFSYEPVYEDRYLAKGNAFALVEAGGMKVALMVCYDLRFPEMSRQLTLDGAELFVVPAAWPFPRLEPWKILTSARAIENQVYLAAANRVGCDGSGTFCGSSRLIDPNGTIVASASEVEQTLIVGEVDRERIAETRSKMRVFADRREDLYRKKGTFYFSE